MRDEIGKDMDREISKEVRKRLRNKRLMQYGGIGVGCVVVLILLFSWMRSSVKESNLVFSEVTRGAIEVLWRYMEKEETVWR